MAQQMTDKLTEKVAELINKSNNQALLHGGELRTEINQGDDGADAYITRISVAADVLQAATDKHGEMGCPNDAKLSEYREAQSASMLHIAEGINAVIKEHLVQGVINEMQQYEALDSGELSDAHLLEDVVKGEEKIPNSVSGGEISFNIVNDGMNQAAKAFANCDITDEMVQTFDEAVKESVKAKRDDMPIHISEKLDTREAGFLETLALNLKAMKIDGFTNLLESIAEIHVNPLQKNQGAEIKLTADFYREHQAAHLYAPKAQLIADALNDTFNPENAILSADRKATVRGATISIPQTMLGSLISRSQEQGTDSYLAEFTDNARALATQNVSRAV